MLLTPLKVVRHLDKCVIGQARAKRDLALCAWKQWLGAGAYTGARFAEVQGVQGPHTILLIGPTGSGKSYLLRQLSRLFGSDLLFFSATSLVQTGYVGLSIDNLLQEAYERCGYDRERTERAILAIDEIDKIRSSHSSGPDVSGGGVQQALLTVFDGRPATVRHARGREVINTSGMMFVCAGAFVGLERLVTQRLSAGSTVGFGKQSKPAEPAGITEVQTDDLVRFGMIPEFIGRFSTISFLEELSARDLANVLRQGQDSVVKRKQHLFASLGVELTFE
ncbi:MAG: AAA family ATPase, partial [Deltaproteobacteria bacterium]|nr:AAA family ATPase [Deltaproteobacteria bacterium]